jgi:hypothetical protein
MNYFIKNTIGLLFVVLLVSVVFSCKERTKNNSESSPNEAAVASKDYKRVEIPSVITDNDLRRKFLLVHFWDNLNLKDTSFTANPIYIREPFREYLDLLVVSGYTESKESVLILTKKVMASQINVIKYFLAVFEEGLYDPNSMYKNDELYITFIEEVLKREALPFEIKEKLSFQLNMLVKNRVNTKAANVEFITAEGKSTSLYNVKSPFILLLFYEPDCQNCNIAIEMMKSSNTLKEAGNKIKVVALYTGDNRALWNSHLKNMSKDWIVGFDSKNSVINNSIYDRRSAPSFYILDAGKTVLVKDATYDTCIRFIKENII